MIIHLKTNAVRKDVFVPNNATIRDMIGVIGLGHFWGHKVCIIASFYNEWLNFEETADEEMWGEIDNAMVDDWIVEHLNDYEYYVDSYEVKNKK